jgi:hypothetical protein
MVDHYIKPLNVLYDRRHTKQISIQRRHRYLNMQIFERFELLVRFEFPGQTRNCRWDIDGFVCDIRNILYGHKGKRQSRSFHQNK